MTIEAIERDFKHKVCEQVRLETEGVNRFRVFTPFMFEDGDHLAVVLRQEHDHWVLSDEGHTYMHLTYDLDEASLQKGTRQKVITNALDAFSVEDRDGELRLPVVENRYGDALFSFIQALLKVSDVTFLSRERVRSTFIEDFQSLMLEAVPEARRSFDWHDPNNDPDGKYLVDCRINGMARPIYIFALPNDDKVRDATISVLNFERWQHQFHSVAIFEEQESVNRKVLARFSDICEKQFSSLGANRDRIIRYLSEAIAQNV
jgi:hypothetical protein